ncbi:MAG: hypothetical protein ACK5NY_06795 [Burkholderiaceae bacterium]|jgi:hypothetical protein
MSRTIHLYYRHVHIKADAFSRDPNKARPAWFSHERCFRNLLQTIRLDPRGAQVKITIVYDGSTDDFMSDFVAGYYANQEYGIQLQFIQGGSDKNSFLITLAMARGAAVPGTDIIYLLENDYMHAPGWVSKVLELYDTGLSFDIVSLYDHADKYMAAMYPTLTAQIVHTRTHHWRTAPSTCASFMLEKSKFDRDYDVLAAGLTDYYFFSRLVGERGRILLTPLPGLATHSMEGYLSPAVEWENYVY